MIRRPSQYLANGQQESKGLLNPFKDLLSEITLLVLGLSCLLMTQPALAGGGHAHGPSGEPVVQSNAVEINDTTARNIGLELTTATKRPVFEPVRGWGRIDVKPSDRQLVSSRIQGQILELHVEKGQSVSAGDPMAVVESLQMGNPPPRATYRAPTGGIVTEIYASPGEGVSANQRILSMTSPEDVRIRTQVHERNLDQIEHTTTANITPSPGADTSWTASVNHVDPHVDPTSGYGTVWLKPDHNGFKPYFGKRVSVDLLTGSAEPYIAIPRPALLGTSGNHFVFVQSPDHPRVFLKRKVVVGPRNGHRVAIKDGLEPDDRVVVEGNYQLKYAPSAEADDTAASESTGGDHGHAHGNQQSSTQGGHDHGNTSPSSEEGHAHDENGGHQPHGSNQHSGHGHEHEGGMDH